MLLILVANTHFAPVYAATKATIIVRGTSMGVSTRYIGANGIMEYDSTTLHNIGFNTWRVWNDITIFEPTNDTTYGALSPAAIKANVNVIPWNVWDSRMGKYRSFFAQTQADGVKLVLALRNTGDNHSASWMANPPRTTADWNEWWEHVFATVYWLNVRHEYHVNDFEIFNEPNRSDQGWKGTEADYLKFAQCTRNAIDYVYKTYLPKRAYHVFGPSVEYPQVGSDASVPNGKGWIYDLLHLAPSPVNAVSYHQYATASQLADGIRYAHDQMQKTGHGNFPLWLTEWGSYDEQTKAQKIDPHGNDNEPFAVRIINNLIEFSRPSKDHVQGSHYYIWQDGGYGDGILDQHGNKRTVYYALRLATRALRGGIPTYQSTTSTSDLTAITTKNSTGKINLLVTNINPKTSYVVNTNISALFPRSGRSISWRYDAKNNDTQATGPLVHKGHMQFTMPASSAVLIRLTPVKYNAGAGD
jgi:hypothetical protein